MTSLAGGFLAEIKGKGIQHPRLRLENSWKPSSEGGNEDSSVESTLFLRAALTAMAVSWLL